MTNVDMLVEENTLIIKVDISKRFGPSKSGLTEIIATTGGNVGAPDHEDIKVGLNIYTKKK